MQQAAALSGAYREALQAVIDRRERTANELSAGEDDEVENMEEPVEDEDEDERQHSGNSWRGRLGKLTRTAIEGVLSRYNKLRGRTKQRKEQFVEGVSQLEGPVKRSLEHLVREHEQVVSSAAGSAVTGHRRSRQEYEEGDEEEGEVQQREAGEGRDPPRTTVEKVLDAIDNYDPNVSRFMNLPTAEEIRDRHQRYREATSNDAIAQCVCV